MEPFDLDLAGFLALAGPAVVARMRQQAQARLNAGVGMLTATRSFIADEGGKQVRVTAGRTRVIEGHELATRYPDSFAPDPALAELERGTWRGSRPSRPSPRPPRVFSPRRPRHPVPARRPRRPWELPPTSPRLARKSWELPSVRSYNRREIRLRDEPGEVKVTLSRTARADLLRMLREMTGRDGLEAGGVLIGPRRIIGNLAEVVVVGDTGPRAQRKEASLIRDPEHDLRLANTIRRSSEGRLAEIGCWHSHPGGGDVPSAADLAHFGQMRNLLDLSVFVAAIGVPHPERGWELPQLAFWVTRSGFGDLADVCERAACSY